MERVLLIMRVVAECFPTKHTTLQKTLLKSARNFVLRKATSTVVLSIQKNAFVETTFPRNLPKDNLTVTWIAVETSLKSAEAETELMFTTLQVPRNYYISN